uniref:Otospiralin n=1 Tax=Mastacembelus armatus TaxID=205130 RepID=A0A3Q3MHG0_9TELE
MRAVCVSLLVYSLLLGCLPPAGVASAHTAHTLHSMDPRMEESEVAEREKQSLPYWGLWSSDFFGWLEELRAQAAYDGMEDLARTFWAHFPIGRELGYDSPEH